MIQQQVQQVVVSEGDAVAHSLVATVKACHHPPHPRHYFPSPLHVLGQLGLKRLLVLWQLLQIVLLAHLIVGVDRGDIFAAEVLLAIIHHVYQGSLLLVFSIQPEGPA